MKINVSTEETVVRKGNKSFVKAVGKDYYPHIDVLCSVKDTGNGYIAKFPSHSSCYQDYYVCLDYAQARDLILGLSAFKKELGFKE
jgi:hypothetical protein